MASPRRAFSQQVKQEAWNRCRGRCECVCNCWNHAPGMCGADLIPGLAIPRRVLEGRSEDSFELNNCELVCMPCAMHLQIYGLLRMDQAIRLSRTGALARTEMPELSYSPGACAVLGHNGPGSARNDRSLIERRFILYSNAR
jgi:hypothetical protein